jgi:ABC-type lipoprotein release transport system permease subunit
MLARAELRRRWRSVVVLAVMAGFVGAVVLALVAGALGALVAVVALVAVGFALVTAVRRRRRDLAVLKTLGFDRRQVRSTVAWHATTVAGIGLVVGIPLGLVTGRLAWRMVADELGVGTDPTRPALAILFVVPVALVAVNLVAALPARRAARTRPAVVLRSE